MAITPTLPLLFAQQFGPTAQLVSLQATQPEAAQAMTSALTEAMLREQSQQVQKPDVGSAAADIKKEGDGGGNAFAGTGQNGQRRKKETDLPDETASSIQSNPFVGQFLNRTI